MAIRNNMIETILILPSYHARRTEWSSLSASNDLS
jgi:hypothetical protein